VKLVWLESSGKLQTCLGPAKLIRNATDIAVILPPFQVVHTSHCEQGRGMYFEELVFSFRVA
jgi:hypothetical protein